jgi:hypothetical protein
MAVGEIIREDEVQRTPRGRTATYDDELLALLSTLEPGMAARLDALAVTDKDQRSSTSAHIRKHFEEVHGEDAKCRIDYSPDGVPQVRFPKS